MFSHKTNTLETHLGTKPESFIILINIFLYSPDSEVGLHLKKD